MNPFSSYHIINAEEIIRSNIRPNYIFEDASSLLNVLSPLTLITKTESQKASRLHTDVTQRLKTKPNTLSLLNYFGYELDETGNYKYRSTNSASEKTRQQNAANEFQNFYNDLKKIKDGSAVGFVNFIQNLNKRLQSDYSHYDEYEESQQQQQSSSRTSFRPPSPPPMPSFSKVKEGNEKTAEIVRNFKESIVPRMGGRPPHSFIRRKLLLLLLKQINPEVISFGDELLDSEIDRRVSVMRQKDRNQDAGSGNEVYFECLIRTNLNEEKALEMLLNNRPNLKPPPEPERPRELTTTTIANSVQHLQQHWNLLNQITNENRAAQMLLHEGDEWKNTVHVVNTIIQLRQQYNNEQVQNQIFSKMHRLIYSELSSIVGPQSSVKIELLAYALCKVPCDSVEHLNMAYIKDILRSCSDTEVSENFQDNAIKSLAVECPICGGSFPRARMETMFLCDHMCCLNCVKQYYRITIREIRDPLALKKLTCFQEELEISDDIKLNFFQYLGSKLNQWFTDERLILDAYQENLFMATKDTKIKKCGNPRCTGFFDINNNHIIRAQCPHCQFQQCQQCCRKWHNEHKGVSCEQYAEWLKDNDPDDPEVQLTKYLNTAGMVCPNEECKAIYEYQAGGCEHFKCRQCRTEFCRICSALFYNPSQNTFCPRTNCPLRNSLHAHCFLNCFREIRDAEVDDIAKLLTDHNVNVAEELKQKPMANGPVCPVEDCKNAASAACENRFCDQCYKQFLCLFVWRNEIEPWKLYTDNNLRQKLISASVTVPANATRDALIALAQQHLVPLLGKPKPIPRIRH